MWVTGPQAFGASSAGRSCIECGTTEPLSEMLMLQTVALLTMPQCRPPPGHKNTLINQLWESGEFREG